MSLPPRRYDEVAEILAEGVERSRRCPRRDPSLQRHGAVTRSPPTPHRRPATGRRCSAALAERGYEPAIGADGVVRLRNCPFDRLGARTIAS